MRDGHVERTLRTRKEVNYKDLDQSDLSVYAPDPKPVPKDRLEFINRPVRVLTAAELKATFSSSDDDRIEEVIRQLNAFEPETSSSLEVIFHLYR